LGDIKKAYDKKPKAGSRVLAGMDARGHYDAFISQGQRLWQIKMEQVSPTSFEGVGGLVARRIDDAIEQEMQRGTTIPFMAVSPQSADLAIVINGVGQRSNQAVHDLKTQLPKGVRKVNAGLNDELERILHRRRPMAMGMYR